MLLLHSRLVLLFLQHLVDLDDFVLEFPVAVFQFLNILRPASDLDYLMSSESRSLSRRFLRLVRGVSKKSFSPPLAGRFRLLLLMNKIILHLQKCNITITMATASNQTLCAPSERVVTSDPIRQSFYPYATLMYPFSPQDFPHWFFRIHPSPLYPTSNTA